MYLPAQTANPALSWHAVAQNSSSKSSRIAIMLILRSTTGSTYRDQYVPVHWHPSMYQYVQVHLLSYIVMYCHFPMAVIDCCFPCLVRTRTYSYVLFELCLCQYALVTVRAGMYHHEKFSESTVLRLPTSAYFRSAYLS